MQGDAEHWARQGREPSLLYRGAELVQAMAWKTARAQEGRRPGALLGAFLAASEAQEAADAQQKRETAAQLEIERQQKLVAAQKLARRTQQAAAIFGVLALLASGVGAVAFLEYQRAQRQTEVAKESTALASKRLEQVIEVADALIFNIDQRLAVLPGT